MLSDLSKFSFFCGKHHNIDVILIKFESDPVLDIEVKKLVGRKWSNTLKSWYVLDIPSNRILFGLQLKIIGKTAISKIDEVNIPAFNRFVDQLKLKAYSPSTIKTYSVEFANFLQAIKTNPIDTFTSDRLRAYFLFCIDTLHLSENTLHSRINAIKFYFEQVENREKFFFDIPRPQKPTLLPKVIDKKDILKMLSVIENNKHRLMMMLCYGMGLRVSEIVNLKIEHIDSKRMQVLIESGKGKKDRYTNLPEKLLNYLREYYLEYKPVEYLFMGQNGGQYSVRSVQMVFKNAMIKAKINKRVGIHSLRHSYATHLLDAGTDMVFIQKLLGHNNIKTTEIYAKVSTKILSKVKSPLDDLL